MEGSRAAQQQQTAAARWLCFAEWLARQAGGPAEEAVSEASASDADEADLLLPAADSAAAAGPSISSSGGGRSAGAPLQPAAAGAALPGHPARHATLAPRLPDCRAETRLTSESASRARQEMTVMLAAPGMPLHQAPVLTARQASALMSAICEPLLSLPVGRLTRKLSAPTKLQPTEDRGMLSLWLLPDDSLSLVWQAAAHLAPADLAATAGGDGASSSSSGTSSSSSPDSNSSGAGADQQQQQQQQAEQQPELRQSCSVAVWEELAHFPPLAHLVDDAPVVTIHMLRGDASGRSFYIRVRGDVAEANLEAATAAVPDAARLLAAQAERETGEAGSGTAAVAAEAAGAPRMYFWLTDRDLGRAVYSLGRLKSLLKRPPTLSKRSGVPERQLAQLGAWVARADAAAAEHQRQAPAAAVQQAADGAAVAGVLGEHGSALPVDAAAAAASVEQLGGGPAHPAGASAGGGPLSPLLQAPGLLLGQHSMAAAAQGGVTALLPPGQPVGGAIMAAAPAYSTGSSGGEEGVVASGSSTVSATAAALYQDQRFNLVCPCTISVVVGMRVEGAGADPSGLPAEASSRARVVAERHAKAAVDRSGRQRIEERLAEVVIRNIRAQRNRARQQRQSQRDGAVRAAAAERALALARQATGRSAPPAAAAADGAAVAGEQSPPQQQTEVAWGPEASGPAPARSPFDMPRDEPEASSSASGVAAAAAAGSASPAPAPALSSTASSSGGGGGEGAFSSEAAQPVPATLLPGGRVTINNLHSLLNTQGSLEAGGAQAGAPNELGAAAAATATAGGGTGPEAQPAAAGVLSVSDLADLLGKHAKLE